METRLPGERHDGCHVLAGRVERVDAREIRFGVAASDFPIVGNTVLRGLRRGSPVSFRGETGGDEREQGYFGLVADWRATASCVGVSVCLGTGVLREIHVS